MAEAAELLAALLQARQTILPKRLLAPGPDAEQLAQILDAAAHAPDHGQLLPWRFVQIGAGHRAALGEVFAQALLERDAAALPEQLRQAREKAQRAPVLLLLVVNAGTGDAEIDLLERVVSAGCAVQSVLLMATALGFASALTSGKALKSQVLRRFFGLAEQDHALCFVSLGTALQARAQRVRPHRSQYLTHLSTDP